MGSPLGGDWKHPYYAQSTAAVVKHNWLLLVHGPNYTHALYSEQKEEADTNYPEYMTRNDQPNDPKGHYRR
jgi:hypothetical protein